MPYFKVKLKKSNVKKAFPYMKPFCKGMYQRTVHLQELFRSNAFSLIQTTF